jgi:hypothetical protein
VSDLQYRPRSITEIIDAAFLLYRQDALRYILITAVAYAPMLVFQLVFLDPTSVSLTTGLFGFASYVVGFFSFALMSASLVRLSAEAYLGRDMEIGAAIREVLPRVPSILAGTLIRIILIFISALALIIPAFWMFARTFAVTPIIVQERADVARALNRSAQLSNNRKLAILGCYALTFLIFYVVTLAFGFVAALVGGGILFTLITTVATVVIYPVIGIMEMVLYYDSRIRAEGYDVELMANALGTATS